MAGNILWRWRLGQESASYAQYQDFGYATTGEFVASIIGIAGSLFSSCLGGERSQMSGWNDLGRTTTCIVVLAVLVGPMAWDETPESKGAPELLCHSLS
jgi:hypothetical protein